MKIINPIDKSGPAVHIPTKSTLDIYATGSGLVILVIQRGRERFEIPLPPAYAEQAAAALRKAAQFEYQKAMLKGVEIVDGKVPA